MNRINRLIIGAGVPGSLLTGAVIGATIAGPLGVSAATSSSAAATAASPAAGSGTFVPNETAAHEAGESGASMAVTWPRLLARPSATRSASSKTTPPLARLDA